MVGYLAGAMTRFYDDGRYEEATRWREYVKNYLAETNIAIFDPTDESDKHFKYPANYSNGVVLQNYAYLRKCDFVLVNLEYFEDSIGTIWECCTSYNEHKPVIAFGTSRWESRPHFRSIISVQLETVEDACQYILSMFRQKI